MYVRDLQGKEYVMQATSTGDYELNGNQSITVDLPCKSHPTEEVYSYVASGILFLTAR